MQENRSAISDTAHPSAQLCKGASLTENLFAFVCAEHPGFGKDSYLSFDELGKLRKKYLEKLLRDENAELSHLEKQVVDAIHDNATLSENINIAAGENTTPGQRAADAIASFGGSWTFIASFFSVLLLWIATNILLASRAFDPFPFILLNLILSCLAAIQAPIIMMSQNRQEEKDRRRSENDYKINLKAELEVRLLHEKIDHLIVHQNQRLLEIQEMQVEYLQEISARFKS
jgi:uncharacterized membrane protein